jgi:hypothetical protein
MHVRNADWFAIVLQGLFGALLGVLAGGLLVMNRITRFMARDAESSLVMVVGCMLAGAGLLMMRGDGLLIPTRTLPPVPMRHSALSISFSYALVAVGAAALLFGVARWFHLSQRDSRMDQDRSGGAFLVTPGSACISSGSRWTSTDGGAGSQVGIWGSSGGT